VSELARRGVLTPVTRLHQLGQGTGPIAAFTMADWAWDHLRENPQLVAKIERTVSQVEVAEIDFQ
jgi:hypothetical protein